MKDKKEEEKKEKKKKEENNNNNNNYNNCNYFYYYYIFPPYFRNKNFAFIFSEVGELIFSGHTIKVTVHAMQSSFSPCLRQIYQNTVMSYEHIVSLQSCMQLLLTRWPLVVLQGLEIQFPEWREVIMSAVCLCADKRIMSFYCEDLYGRKNKLGRIHLIVVLNVLHSFSSI